MSSELERRLDALLLDAPEPGAGVGERALERALTVLPVPRRRERRRLRVALVLAATALGLLAVAAGSLAAAGALHVSIGRTKTRSATPLALPPGAAGIAAVVGGRLSVVTRSGFRLQGLPVSAATLSPHALYVAAGVGDSLVAMAPDGRRAWSHPAGGRVVAIAWAPDGLRIAYAARAGRRLALHVIYGNGIHDTVIDRSVRASAPSWRADSLALAYVGAGGRTIVYDLAHRSRKVVPETPPRAFHGPRAALPPLRPGGRVVSVDTSGRTFALVVAGGGTRVVAGTRRRYATVLRLPAGVRVEDVSVR